MGLLFRNALAGLFLVLTAPTAIAADAPASAQDLQIALSNFSFAPNMLHLQRNMSYAAPPDEQCIGRAQFLRAGFLRRNDRGTRRQSQNRERED